MRDRRVGRGPEDTNDAALRTYQAEQQLERRRLTRSVRTQQGHRLARADLEAQVCDREHVATAAGDLTQTGDRFGHRL